MLQLFSWSIDTNIRTVTLLLHELYYALICCFFLVYLLVSLSIEFTIYLAIKLEDFLVNYFFNTHAFYLNDAQPHCLSDPTFITPKFAQSDGRLFVLRWS